MCWLWETASYTWNRCIKVIDNWEKAQKRQSNIFRSIRGIEMFKIEGSGDMEDALQGIAERLAEIEESIEWTKNCLANARTTLDLQKRNKPKYIG